MKSLIKLLLNSLLVFTFFILSGCAAPNVALQKNFWKRTNTKSIEIALGKTPPADLFMRGQGALDFAIAYAVNKDFIKYLNNYNAYSFNQLQSDFVLNLKKGGIQAVIYHDLIEDIENLPDEEHDVKKYSKKSYRSLSLGKHKLLLILSIKRLGADRLYYGMVPLGAPHAICIAEGQLVNLDDDKILWRLTTTQNVPVDGEWNQPPSYPNFTTALNKAVSKAKDALLKDFWSSRFL